MTYFELLIDSVKTFFHVTNISQVVKLLGKDQQQIRNYLGAPPGERGSKTWISYALQAARNRGKSDVTIKILEKCEEIF